MSRALPEEAREADAELRAMQKRTRGATRGAAGAEDKVRMPVRTTPCEGVRCVLTVSLPLPEKALSPNSRTHYMVKAEAVREARWAAACAALAALCAQHAAFAGSRDDVLFAGGCEARVQVTWPDKRRRDLDNVFAALKASFDGFTDAGVWIDDSVVTWILPPARVEKGAPGVQITIEEVA